MYGFLGMSFGGYDMILQDILGGVVFFWLLKSLYQRLFRRIDLNEELFVRDNVAVAVALTGFLLGAFLALGGAVSGLPPDHGNPILAEYAFAVVGCMLAGAIIGDRLLLRSCDCFREICIDRNAGAGFAEGGVHVANGLMTGACLAGDSGTWLVGGMCWGAGMIVLIIAGRLYPLFARFDVFAELRDRNNLAAGIALSGFLVAVGNILRISFAGDFRGWRSSLTEYAMTLLVCIVLLGVVRWLTDAILVPGVRLKDEIAHQKVPNIGAGIIEAFSYITGSFLIGLAFP